MAPDKSLAAEIERLHKAASPAPWTPQPGVERERVRGRFWSTCKGFPSKPVGQMDGQETSAEREANMQLACLLRSHVPEILAALQSRAFEDGARWMRERAARLAEGEVCHGRYRTWSFWPADAHGERGNRDEASELARHSRDIAAAIAALPLQPEGERNV